MALPPTVSSTSSAPESTPGTTLFIWRPVNIMYTCGQTEVFWGYVGPSVPISLVITNVDVAQQAPPATSTGIVPSPLPGGAQPNNPRKRQSGYGGSYLPSISETLSSNVDPNLGNYTWPSVDVPQGWYQMQAIIPSSTITASSPFFVSNGTIVSCVRGADPAPPSSVSSAVPSASSPTSTATSSSVAAIGGSSHSHAGAIAGGVVGGIAFLAAVLAALVYWFCRRRPSLARSTVVGAESGGDKWAIAHKGQGGKRERQARESGQQALPAGTHSQTSSLGGLDNAQTPVGSDEDFGSTIGHEKVVANRQTNALENGAPTFVPYTPRAQKRTSSSSSVSNFGAQYSLGRTSSQRTVVHPEDAYVPRAEHGRRASYGSPRSYAGEVIPMERARRKPVPRYTNAEFSDAPTSYGQGSIDYGTPESGEGLESSRVTLESVHGLQHQSSFGNMKPMHVIIPDMPPTGRD
ncbi:hypothetical protein BV25DRAFT_1825212 [Artomyces pyxidatus]|uniref:Uncharacterized protein n=1 Tax=Artomyces pyxidatus TaxID=48021 RepID=A0ACB8T1Y2_9AGAM|nr:hypothetical protein BV25DRAFT_1825212 [Artomyces pyxidatus]